MPPTTQLSVGYFAGWQSTKKWLVTQEDLTAMYSELRQGGKTDVCLWCDGDGSPEVRIKANANEIAALVLLQTY